MQSMNPGRRIAAAAMMMLVLALPALAAGGQVNLNTATVEQLQLLPRVGPSLAQRIVEYRDRNDGFQVVEDLLLVRGVGEASFEKMKPYLTLSGATTLDEKVRLPRGSASTAGE